MGKPKPKTEGAASAAEDRQAKDRVLAREDRDLPVTLTPREKAARSEELVQAMSKQRRLEDELEGVKADFKGRIARVADDVGALFRTLERGTEIRSVSCERRVNVDGESVDTIRLDTGELVVSRPMTPEERQRELFRSGKRASAAPAAAPPPAAAEEPQP